MIKITLKANPIHSNVFLLDSPRVMLPNLGTLRLVSNFHAWRPPTDVFEIGDHYWVRVEIAGMNGVEFSVILDGNILIVQGTRPENIENSERKSFYQLEINYGEFRTEIELPSTVDIEKTEATYSDGFLNILLPRKESAHIQIKE